MTEFGLVLSVVVMFFVRIGIPLLLLVVLGMIIDRWQKKQHEDAFRQQQRRHA